MSLLTGLNTLDTDMSALFMKLWTPNFDLVKHLDEFRAQKGASQKIDFVYNILQKHRLLVVEFLEDTKSDELSGQHRQAGNGMYKLGKYPEAFHSYVAAISNARTRKTLSLAYANRSVVLFKSEMYQECILDINRALNLGYPHNLRSKLLARKTEAASKTQPSASYHEPIPAISSGLQNAKIPCATNAIELVEKHPKFGRHFVAARDLNVGDLLVVEKPYVAALSDGCQFEEPTIDHCAQCAELCFTLIPCASCTEALYCSDECMSTAYEQYHKYECAIFKTLAFCLPQELRMVYLLALRTAFKLRGKYADIAKKLAEGTEDFGSELGDVFQLKSCLAYTLPEKEFTAALKIAHILHLVKTRTSFFADCPDSEDVFKVVMFKMAFIANVSMQKITESVSCELSLNRIIANGLYGICGRFARSCCPNVAPVSYGNTMVVHVVSPVKKGESCFVDTGSLFARVDFFSALRQADLFKSLNIVCSCKYCAHLTHRQVPPIGHFEHVAQLRNLIKRVANNMDQLKRLIRSFAHKLANVDPKEPFYTTIAQSIFDSFLLLGNNREVALHITPI